MDEFISTNFKNDQGIKNTGTEQALSGRGTIKFNFNDISSLSIKKSKGNLKYISLNVDNNDLKNQYVLFNAGLDCNGVKTTKKQQFNLKSINITVPSIHRNDVKAKGEVILTLQAQSCNEGQQNLYICTLLKSGSDNGSVSCSLFSEIVKCLNSSKKEDKDIQCSTTCDSFDPRDLLPSEKY